MKSPFIHGRRSRLVLPVLCTLAAAAKAQDSSPATTQSAASEPAVELPAALLRSLSEIEDFSLSVESEGYYALLEFVRNSDFDPGDKRSALEISDWQVLLDRPKAYRGEPITIEGVVGRHRSWQSRAERLKRFGTVWELDLRHTEFGYPISATVFLTGNADEIGIDSTIQVTGYFVMIQQYPRGNKTLGQKIVLIAKGPTMVSRAAPPPPKVRDEKRWIWGGAAVAAALLVVWIIVRGSAKGGRTDIHRLSATRRASMDLSDDLEEWADEDESLKP